MSKKDKDKAVEEENVNETVNEQTEEQETSENEQQEEKSVEEQLEEKYNELNDRYVRLYSEYDNFRRRTAKEKIEMISNANANVLKDLLTVLDDFERAMQHNKESEDVTSIKEGFELIYNRFNRVLGDKGLKPMESIGEKFDTELHEAIANVPVDAKQKGNVIDVTQKGYFLNDNVLRHAQVVVGQ